MGKEYELENQTRNITKHNLDPVEASLADFMSSVLNSPTAKFLVRNGSSLSDIAALYIAHLLGESSVGELLRSLVNPEPNILCY